MPHIVLTGATGQVAPFMVRHLPAHHRVTLTSRTSLSKVDRPGVRRVICDYDVCESLVTAFRDADVLFIVTNDPMRPEHDRNVVKAAVKAGVGHIIKLSAAAVLDNGAHDLVTEWQRKNEERIRASGIPWTMVRPRSFMSHALQWAPDIRSHNSTYALYPHSRNACIAPEDIAEVSAHLIGDSRHYFQSYQLTGPQPLSAHEQSAILTEVLGRPLACRELSPDEAYRRYSRRYAAAMADALLLSAERQLAGAKSHTTDTVERITGRPATTFAQWALDHRDRFE